MYDNIGAKVKRLAVVTFIIETICSICFGFGIIAKDNVTDGLVILIIGPLVAWVSSWVLYAIGLSAEKSCQNELRTKQILQILESKNINSVKDNDNKIEQNLRSEPKRKAIQCECGELYYGLFCSVCGKKASGNPHFQYNHKYSAPENKTKKCVCGERYYGSTCPNCGRE